MVAWHHWLNGHLFGWTPGVGDRQGGLACCSSCDHKDSNTTERLNLTELMGLDTMTFVFWMLSFKPTFSLSSFTFSRRLFSSSLLPAIMMVSSACLGLLIFVSIILIPACASPSPVSHDILCIQIKEARWQYTALRCSFPNFEPVTLNNHIYIYIYSYIKTTW